MKSISLIAFVFFCISLHAFNGEITLNYTSFNGGDFKIERVLWTFADSNAKMTLSMQNIDNGVQSVSSFIPDLQSTDLLIYSNLPSGDGKLHYYSVDVNKIQAERPNDYRIEKSIETKSIAGYMCTKYIIYGAGTTTETWVTDQIDVPFYSFAPYFKSNTEMQGLAQQKIIGFPMESKTMSAAGNILFQYTVSSVKPKAVEASEFLIPAGYTLAKAGH